MIAVDERPKGYISDASKRKFTFTAGILGAVFLIAQFLLPMVLMVGDMAARTVVVNARASSPTA
jgi:uncharacterized RDD family membrane protein YckC